VGIFATTFADWLHRKEKLWPHVREFADRGIAHAKRMVTTLAEAKTPCELYVIHGHYADAGEVAALMSSTLDVDMCMTGHSLGRNKLEHLLASGTVSKAEIESTYKISRRVEAEERALESAIMVFTSTKQEIDEQWGLYDGLASCACNFCLLSGSSELTVWQQAYYTTCSSSLAICFGRIHKHPWLGLHPLSWTHANPAFGQHKAPVLAIFQTGHKIAINSAMHTSRSNL